MVAIWLAEWEYLKHECQMKATVLVIVVVVVVVVVVVAIILLFVILPNSQRLT